MIRHFLIERISWIIFFLFIQGLFLFVGSIDPSVSLNAMLYIVFLSLVFFVIFLVIRYNRETPFYKSMEEGYPSLELESIKNANLPFEEITEKAIKKQIEYLKRERNKYITSIEQEKDELLSWIHEVKTPLTTMQLMLDRIEDNQLKNQLKYEWLRIHLLLDQQLHQRRIPFMENDVYIEKVDLEQVVFGEIKALQSWCFQKGIGFDVDLKETEVLSDGKWFSFLLRQLLTNAVKYSANSDIYVKSFQENGAIMLEIEDYGRGIKEKDISRIFEKGFTSTSDHKDNISTGMGLYLTKKVAKELKIRMDIRSTYGAGTCFTLTFPQENDFLLTSM